MPLLRALSIGILSSLLVHLIFQLFSIPLPNSHGLPGTIDFIEYWAAASLFFNAQNPYDATLLLAAEQKVGFSSPLALMMWNPPWLLSLFGPVLSLSFPLSAYLWFLLSISLFISGALLCIEPNKRVLIPLIALFLFTPVWASLHYGQLGAVLFFGTALMLHSIRRKSAALEGFSYVLLSLKPHLFFLLMIARLITLVRTKQFSPILFSALYLSLLIALTFYLNPAALPQWFAALSGTSVGPYVPTQSWTVASLTGMARIIFPMLFGFSLPLISVLVPACAISALLIYLYVPRRNLSWPHAFTALLGASVIFSPYAWFFDFTVLFPLVLSVVSVRTKYNYLLICLLFACALAAMHYFAWASYQHELAWFSVLLSILFMCASMASELRPERNIYRSPGAHTLS